MNEDVSNAALDNRARDQYSALSVICGKYLTIKAGESCYIYNNLFICHTIG